MSTIETHRTIRTALANIERYGLLATPRVYEVFFRMAEGVDPDLQKAFDDMVATGEIHRRGAMDKLHAQHIEAGVMSEALTTLSEKLSDSVGAMRDITNAATAQHESFGSKLGQIGGLMKIVKDPLKFLEIIAGAVKATASMQSKTAESTEQLTQLEATVQQLQQEVASIRKEALTDELTGIGNRRRFEHVYEAAFAEARASGTPLTVAMIDVDRFKQFNDRWGHMVGDAALRKVAMHLEANLSGRGIVCRYGGEEFVVVVPGMGADQAFSMLDEARASLATTALIRRDSQETLGNITASFGIANLNDEDTPDTLLARADKLLYAAKDAGRNMAVQDEAQASITSIIARVRHSVPDEEEAASKRLPA